MTDKKNEELTELSGYIPKDLKKEFKKSCADAERTMSEVLTEMVRQWLATHASEHQPPETAIAKPDPTKSGSQSQHPNYPSQPSTVPKGVETPQAFKFRIRDNYFQLMNKGCFTPTRLKELALGEQPTKAEMEKVERILADKRVEE